MADLSLDEFPPHILFKICQFLTAKDLKNIMLVNSNFYEIVISNISLHKKFKLILPEDYSIEQEPIIAHIKTNKMKIDYVEISLKANNQYIDYSWFFETFGENIKILELLKVMQHVLLIIYVIII